MREISPAVGLSVDEYLSLESPLVRDFVKRIRDEKQRGVRPLPSAHLVDRSLLLSPTERRRLLDAVAILVDENVTGRSDMCLQFADLLCRALIHLNLPARLVGGIATYFDGSRFIYEWQHAWVRIGEEVIDGNVDILPENPLVPLGLQVAPYWGPIRGTPQDRRLRDDRRRPDPDQDVADVWWPDLKRWLETDFSR